MRKFILLFVLFLTVGFIALSFGELKSIVETLKKVHAGFFLLALFLQVIWFMVAGMTFFHLYHLVGLDESFYRLTLLAAAANFINVIAPSAGMGGVVVFLNDAQQKGYSSGKVTVANTLYLLFDYLAFLVVLVLGLLVFFRRNDLGPSEIIASLIMVGIALGLALFVYIGSHSAELLGNILAWFARMINKTVNPFLHREYLHEERAHQFAHDLSDGFSSLPRRRQLLLAPVLYSFANKALMICILLVSFLSFEVPFSVGTLIGGFAIAYLFLVVSPTPSGIGVVEGIMPLALTSLLVPWSEAVVITLAYRAITFWIPLGLGGVAFRALHMEDVQ
jgi:glycosyltransferase 2 family protein